MTAPVVATATQIEHDWRFAELIARSWMEQGLAARYRTDPCSVLAEFGIDLADPQAAPVLPADPGDDVVIDDLDRAADVAPFTICTADMGATPVNRQDGVHAKHG